MEFTENDGMKRIILSAAVICTSGCIQQRQALISPVGPAPDPQRVVADSNSGTLVVYSAWRRTGTDDPDHRIHSDYDVLAVEGKPLLHVRNHITPMLEDPATVQLASGKYVVKARVQRYGTVSVPVTIQSNKITALYMDDSTRPESAARANAEEVKLPDGRVIGWAPSVQ